MGRGIEAPHPRTIDTKGSASLRSSWKFSKTDYEANFLHEFHYTIFLKIVDEGVHFFGPHFSQKMTQKYDQKSNFFHRVHFFGSAF